VLRTTRIVISAAAAVCVLAAGAAVVAVTARDDPQPDGGIEHPYAYPELTQDDLAGDVATNIERLQVPDDILDEMSSEALVWTVLDFPYVGNFFASSQVDGGTDFLRGQCNALDALLERDDAEDALRSVRAAFVAADGVATEQWGTLKLEILDQIIATF
jgi:hypothetical protein